MNRLIRDIVEPDPALRARLVSALLVGTSVSVPAGGDVGIDFADIPLCRAADQVGCVITYASYRDTAPPPDNAFFGAPRDGVGQAGCTNPAALSGDEGVLRPIYETDDWVLDDPAAVAEITTPFVALPGLAKAECVVRGERSYLEIRVTGDPADPRTDDVRGDLSPEWGLHAADMNLGQSQLIDIVRAQAEAYVRR